MNIFIGLGNPEEKYQNNRHNVGHMFIDYLVNQLKNLDIKELKEKNNPIAKIYRSENIILAKSLTFMNESGKAIKKILNKFYVPSYKLYVIHDDLDIPLGKFKIQFANGPKLHNGIKSIEKTLKTKDFWRIRIGVDNRKKENWIDGETYVLQNFSPEEKNVLTNEVFLKIIKVLTFDKNV
ncbi:MAG: peptidyl-tRNA hydrolase [Patescibacteria group bacterium]|nr:MAG: peptidyl-tRNA hydrolase [Patescibacteria group bacterium]